MRWPIFFPGQYDRISKAQNEMKKGVALSVPGITLILPLESFRSLSVLYFQLILLDHFEHMR